MPSGIYKHHSHQLFQKGHKAWNKGRKGLQTHSVKAKIKISKSLMGKCGKYARRWSGGKCQRKEDGRWLEFVPNHPFANHQGYVYRSRLVMERKIGRYLEPEEVVHHIDGNPSNDKPENLMLFPNQIAHAKFHQKLLKD